MNQEVISIFTICWNSQSVRLCESLDPEVVAEHRKSSPYVYGYFNVPSSWLYSCENPDFMIPLLEKIRKQNPTIIVVAFQEDVYPGSYLHSHLLPEVLPQYGYTLVDRSVLMGMGKTTATGLYNADIVTRGLRLSVYVRSNVSSEIKEASQALVYTNSYFRNKGACAIYLTLPTNENLAIIDAHLPFDAKSLKDSVLKQDDLIRDNSVYDQDIFYNEAYRTLVLDAPAKPVYVLFMGDLNYRIKPFNNWSSQATGTRLLETLRIDPNQYTQLIKQYDEYWQQAAKKNIYLFNEGINNNGPQFSPTCKMAKPRPIDTVDIFSYKIGEFYQRVPSHCDRILYTTLRSTGPQLICVEYNRFDYGNTVKSDHALVYGTFTFRL